MREKRSSGVSRLVRGIIVLALLASLPFIRLCIFAFNPYQTSSSTSSESTDFENSKVIEIRKGDNPNEIAKNLTAQGIIADTRSFIFLGKLTRRWKGIKAGEYRLSAGMAPVEIFSTLNSGISIAHPLTVREGENIFEIANDLHGKGLVNRERFLALAQDKTFIRNLDLFGATPPSSLEGYLFPDTYFFNRTLTEEDMLKQMVRHFFNFWGKEEERLAAQLGMTRNEVVILASIVEKETGAAEERGIISSVFHNRIKIKMRLQSDPTTIYGMWKRYKGKIQKTDLFAKNLYNTYVVPALPIGAISNPGKEAISAVLRPHDTNYLFFVSHNDGTHQFSRTLAEHNSAVRKFQLDPKAREGKSWRDRLRKPALKQF